MKLCLLLLASASLQFDFSNPFSGLSSIGDSIKDAFKPVADGVKHIPNPIDAAKAIPNPLDAFKTFPNPIAHIPNPLDTLKDLPNQVKNTLNPQDSFKKLQESIQAAFKGIHFPPIVPPTVPTIETPKLPDLKGLDPRKIFHAPPTLPHGGFKQFCELTCEKVAIDANPCHKLPKLLKDKCCNTLCAVA